MLGGNAIKLTSTKCVSTAPHETDTFFGRRILSLVPFRHEESADDVEDEPSEPGELLRHIARSLSAPREMLCPVGCNLAETIGR